MATKLIPRMARVDITWREGKATDYQIRSATPHEVTVHANGETKIITPP